jgi:hypothetical protein
MVAAPSGTAFPATALREHSPRARQGSSMPRRLTSVPEPTRLPSSPGRQALWSELTVPRGRQRNGKGAPP